jgi:uncharacterized GH25 family protein
MACCMSLRKSCFAIAIMAVFLAMSASADIVDLNHGIRLSTPSYISSGEDFDLTITFREPDATENNVNVFIEITANGVIVHEEDRIMDFVRDEDVEITINSRDFETEREGKPWTENLMNYGCGDVILEVEVSDEVFPESASRTIEIEPSDDDYELNYIIEPSGFSLTVPFKVTVTDEDDKAIRAWVKFTWLDDSRDRRAGEWDYSKSVSGNATTRGEVSFDSFSREMGSSAYGLYQMDIYMDGRCKVTETFTIANALNISDPTPTNPQVGESFRVLVTKPDGNPATGLFIYLSPGGMRASVGLDGYASFTVSAEGSYTLSAGGTGTPYGETLKVIRVEKKSALVPSASPEPPKVGEAMTITVKSDSDPISGVTVFVRRLGASEERLSVTTDSSGRITYTPTQAGEYTIRAEKTGYETGSSTVQIKNTFKLVMPDMSNILRGETVVVTVTDQSGNPVPTASVSVEGTSITGLTDPGGRFSFVMETPGAYVLSVRKADFADLRHTFTTTGKLEVKLSHREITLGDDIKISVTNREGILTPAQIRVQAPAGVQTHSGSEYQFRPDRTGTYLVRAEALNYETGENNFTVKPKPIAFTYSFRDGKLIINATSRDSPVSGISMNVEAEGESWTITTDASGLAFLDGVEKGINYTVTVENQDYERRQINAVMDSGWIDSELLVPLAIIILIILILLVFIIVLVALVHRKKKDSKRDGFRRMGGGSKLSF